MAAVLRVIGFAVLPSLALLWGVHRLDRRHEPWRWVAGTYGLGAVLGAITVALLVGLARWLDFDLGDRSGRASGFVFLFAVVAPIAELTKVAASWPAFRSRHFDEPTDGFVYSGSAALGYGAVQVGLVLAVQGNGVLWIVRALLALPAQLFFATLWGYALGRARAKHDTGPLFPALWVLSVLLHGFYIYLLAGRGDGALAGAVPLVLAMGLFAAFAVRDLRRRSEALHALSPRPATQARTRRPPRTFREVQAALARGERGTRIHWVLFGALMMLGAMVLGFALAVVVGHLAHIDFSTFDEANLRTATPLLLLAAGVLAGLPIAGYLLAKASEPPTLFEPAMAALLALVLALVAFGLSGGMALVWGLACAPAAWGFACAGAWVGRVGREPSAAPASPP